MNRSTATLPKINVEKIPFARFSQFSKRDIAYTEGADTLRPFYKYEVNMDAFEQVIKDKSKQPINRALLVDVLQQQYADLPDTALVQQQIKRLAEKDTYTIVTAHQPSLFTGPLYYIYKIISTIRLTEELNRAYPQHHFVPVFITGGEDHDFEEMNHLRLFNQEIVWENDEKGSVGMMKTDSLRPVLEQLKAILGTSDKAQEIYRLLHDTHTGYPIYGQAAVAMTHALFGDKGLVVLNMNNAALKRAFIPVLREELLEQPSHELIQATQQALEKAGFQSQAHAREINIFYLHDQLRERIVQEDGLYKVLNTNLSFSETALLDLLEKHPERFSPNVNLRPLYQEYILPNLAYIGGGGELAYWMERQGQFAHFGVNFPMLIRRNSVLWIDKGVQKRFAKFGLTLSDFMEEEHRLIKNYVARQANVSLSLAAQKASLEKLFGEIAHIAKDIDPTLQKKVLAEGVKQQKVIDQLEGRLIRAEKQKHDVALQQIKATREKLFPNNGLQERTENFIPFFLKHGWAYFEILLQHLHPLEKGMVVVYVL